MTKSELILRLAELNPHLYHRDVERIVTGLRWTRVQPVLSVTGAPTRADLDAAWELGAAIAALVAERSA